MSEEYYENRYLKLDIQELKLEVQCLKWLLIILSLGCLVMGLLFGAVIDHYYLHLTNWLF